MSNGKIRGLLVASIIIGSSLSLFYLILLRSTLTITFSQVLCDWLVNILIVLLEVFGISLLLNWMIESTRKRRSEPRQQIAVRRLFTVLGRDLYIQLARNNKTGEPLPEKEDLLLREKGIVTPSTNLQLDKYLLHIATITHSAIRNIEQLIGQFGDLFEIEFVNELFQLGEIGYYLIQDGGIIKHHIIPIKDDEKRIECAETIFKTFDPLRKQLMKACTIIIVNRLYPLSSPSLQNKIRFYLLNFFTAYYPKICDTILNGKRMKISRKRENTNSTNLQAQFH
ncbi:MAG: hypothetical protein ACFFEV_00310 [Candidatus Thorarchaeota archaeon]